MGEHLGFVEGLLARLHGPMSLRLLMQPMMALFFAVRDGRRDARDGNPPYLWGLLSDRANRREMLASGWRSIAKVFVVAIVLDLAFQSVAFRDLRPAGALLAGVIFALVPYLVLRGPINRLLRRRVRGVEP